MSLVPKLYFKFKNGEDVDFLTERNTRIITSIVIKKPIGKGGFSTVRKGFMAIPKSKRFGFVRGINVAVKDMYRRGKDSEATEVSLIRALKAETFVVDLLGIDSIPNGVRLVLTYCLPHGIDYYTHFVPLEDRYLVVEHLAYPILSAVKAVHDAGYFHQDIKPNNILLTPEGIPKLIDFGIARKKGESGSTGGTPEFMAPELFLGSESSEVTDAFSFGLSLGAMLRLKNSLFPDGLFIGASRTQATERYKAILDVENTENIPKEFEDRYYSLYLLDKPEARKSLTDLIKGFVKFDETKRASINMVLRTKLAKSCLEFWKNGECAERCQDEAYSRAKTELERAIKTSEKGKKERMFR